MPNIKLKECSSTDTLNAFMEEVSRQVKEQTGRGFTWRIEPWNSGYTLHYEPEAAEVIGVEAITEGQKQIRKLYGNHVQAGTQGVYSIPRGKIRKAMEIFFEQKGETVKAERWL